MKIAIWILGATCTGKSHYGKIIAEKLGAELKHLDTVNDRMKIDKMTKEEGYAHILLSWKNLIIVDGIIPFNRKEDMKIVMNFLKCNDYEIIYVLANPYYEKWLKNIESRKVEIPNSNPKILQAGEYNEYNQGLKKRLGRFIEIKNDDDLDDISQEQLRNLQYQHSGFTDVKWEQLKVPSAGNTLLDLGCSSCKFGKYFMREGGIEYQGLDCNWSYLINDRAKLLDLNDLEKWRKPFDIVVSTSVMHYIHDKEKFISNCERLTKKLCVLEIPLYKGKGKKLHLGSRGLYFPTRDLFEEWVGKYFSSFECLGESIVEDGSWRLIYHCKK